MVPRVSTATILRNVHDSIIVTDLQGNVLLANPAAERIYGYSASEINGRHVGILYFPEDLPLLDSVILQPLQTAPFIDVTIRNRHKNGREMFVDLRVAVLRKTDGTPQGLIGCSNDVTARVLAEIEVERSKQDLKNRIEERTRDLFETVQRLSAEAAERRRLADALRSSEQRLQHLLNSIPGVVYSCSAEEPFPITFVSESAKRIFGIPSQELNDHSVWVSRIHPDDRAPAVDSITQVLTSGKSAADYRFQSGHGTLRWVRDSVALIRDENDKPVEIVGFCEDITDTRAAEDAIRERERSRAAADALIEAQEAERTRISRELHDQFMQKLGSLVLDLAAARRRVPGHLRGVRRELHDVTTRMGELCDALGEVAHQLHSATLQHLGLRAALKHECDILSRKTGIAVEYYSCEYCCDVSEQSALCVYRVVQESFRNITRHSNARQAWLTLRADTDTLHVSIRDAGVGFDPASRTTSRGLGLTSMAERVRLLGGSFELTSAPAQGVQIDVALPKGNVRDG